jgi:hypothetical protein
MRHKKAWHLVKPETVLVVDLWKSPASGQYIIDLGVLIRRLDPNMTPGANVCHISRRLSSLVTDFGIARQNPDQATQKTALQSALDPGDQSTTDADVTKIVSTALVTYGIPFLEAWDTFEKIRNLLKDRGNAFSRNTYPWAIVYKLFEMPIPAS